MEREPSEWAKAHANKLISDAFAGKWMYDGGVRDLALALDAARAVPEGHVRLPDGREVKVLGTLPMTADGCVATINGTFYTPPEGDLDGICSMAAWSEGGSPVGKRIGFPVTYIGAERTWNSNECYSTPEAALAASKPAAERKEQA